MKTRFANLFMNVCPLVVGLAVAAVLLPAMAPAAPTVPPSRYVIGPPGGDWQCRDAAGCVARCNDGEGGVKEVTFRNGDIVSEENGWVVTPDDGWVKLHNPPPQPQPKPQAESWWQKFRRWCGGG